MKKINYFFLLSMLLMISGCTSNTTGNNNGTTPEHTQVKHPQWSRNAVIYEVNVRQYTEEGTFNAFANHLPRLKELGVDILWFMPIHPISEVNRKGTLGSYYAVQNYKGVNPEFGTPEEFKALVEQAHAMGFKVLLDWVANHTGCDNIWLAEHPEWYVTDEEGNYIGPYDWTDTYKLDYTNQEMRAAMIDALKYWVSDFDIDGYRCDVAFEVPTDFWDEARKQLDEIKPVFMLAEAEHPDLTVKAFDMVYNWPLKDVMNNIAKGEEAEEGDYIHESLAGLNKPGRYHATDLDVLFARQAELFPVDSYQMNQITNHDLNSWEGTEFERLGNGVEAFAILTYTIPGMPLIYTGQETGMDRALEFFEKDTPPDWTINDTFLCYQKLNALKHNQAALAAGTEGGEMIRYYTESPDAYIFSRTKGTSTVLVYLNLSDNPIGLEYRDREPEGEYTNYFTGTSEELPSTLGSWEYFVFIK